MLSSSSLEVSSQVTAAAGLEYALLTTTESQMVWVKQDRKMETIEQKKPRGAVQSLTVPLFSLHLCLSQGAHSLTHTQPCKHFGLAVS